ncbi:hypothetical protein LWI28_000049 [Acer negundo]|uniref:protein-disulfide reductase n=1 Tax=Acer negundo TaxID=4023 RepID=A0AAD5IJZ4_ACENE|nr:hypothetical protein LWI28_000049 [Acer negundo]
MTDGESSVAQTINGGDAHDIQSILSSSERDFLVRNNGDQVKISSLKGKKIGLYFSASWCGPCQKFTPTLVEMYNELSPKGDFEVIFVSGDEDDNSFNGYFSKMPWLAIPFSDSEMRDRLDELFKVMGIPHLVLLDENGKVTSDSGVEIIREYGTEGYPFTTEKIKELKEQEERAKREQSLKSILVTHSRDFLVASDGKKVPVAELERKTVGLYFSASSYKPSTDFTPKLVEVYEKLKDKGESFEIVLISLDDDEESFKQDLGSMPWLALPFKDKSCEKLVRYFELSTLPTLVIIGPDGKTLNCNVAEAIEEHGIEAFPFTPEKFAELAAIEKAREEAQTLESVLVSGDRDFVIGKDGAKIPVSDLVGKNILLYFSAHWCPPCRAFLPKLIEAYHTIKAKDQAFEVVFISSDKNQSSFDEFFSGMPWLALPFGDARKASLGRKFKVYGIPMLVAIGPTGRTVTKEARDMITSHGADAYPFTEEHLKELEKKNEEMAKGWPEKVKHALHEEHELERSRCPNYDCDGCKEEGNTWAFCCEECDFYLHPKCALEEDKGTKEDDDKEQNPTKEGRICDGDNEYSSHQIQSVLMAETEVLKTRMDVHKSKRNIKPKVFDPAISKFFVQLPRKLQNCLQARFMKFAKDREGENSASSVLRKGKGSSTALEVDLERQLQCWRENPSWADQPPEIKVSVPKGSLCNLNVKVDVGLPPDAVYNIVTDPDNKRVFKNIKEVISRKVLVDEGLRQVVELDQAAIWKFLWWSGTISVNVLVDQNREDHSMKFKQVKTGFMEKFEGCWRVEPLFVDEKLCFPYKPKTWADYHLCTGGNGRIASRVSLEQLIQPAIVPPPPISWYLRGITAKTTEMLINDLLAETDRIRRGLDTATKSNENLEERCREIEDDFQIDQISNIKERWTLRRRNAKQHHKRLLTG